MISEHLEIVTCNKWDEAKARLGSFDGDWVFRGQGSSDWGLTTSLERAAGTDITGLNLYEEWVRDEFERGAHQFISPHHIPVDDIEWLALMQHHGAPTRLLDFTYSPYVAAYFAMENASTWCSVWVVHAAFLHTAGLHEFVQDGEFFFNGYHYKQYLNFAFTNGQPWVFPVEPRKKNERLLAQQGLFLMPSDSKRTFEANLSAAVSHDGLHDWTRTVYRVDINREARIEALRDLRKMNISRATLFPGLDGFAQSIRYGRLPM